MRIISAVPSWTETLLNCGVDVVGRTRFCIHPKDEVTKIRAVGGTKDIDWSIVKELKADLLLLDREENPRSMADEAPCEVFATHVRAIEDVAPELLRLSARFAIGSSQRKSLHDMAARWQVVEKHSPRHLVNWSDLPGLMDWLKLPSSPASEQVIYVIWREPWMAATAGTFIASVLEKVGIARLWPAPETAANKYPTFELGELPEKTVMLCSSEPFPFGKTKFRAELQATGRPCAIVDGEAFSWFGVRTLEFLWSTLKLG